MKYLVYLITLLFSTAVAQNPTILQGNYVSNVFGQANFVLNPNAQTSTTNVTVSNATVTRPSPIVTPLVATTEFNVEVTSANGTITWATRSFDAGMKNQNCEARFSYRGFQATSKAQIKQGANVIAELTLTPSATDPRIASINFPCGDLSGATTFVITDSATLSGTNEIGGIYVGLATNLGQYNAVENWQSFTVSYITGQPTNTTTEGFYRRVGDSAQIRYKVIGSLTAALSASNLVWDLPPGLVIDNSKTTTRPNGRGYDGSGSAFGTFDTSGYNAAFCEYTTVGTPGVRPLIRKVVATNNVGTYQPVSTSTFPSTALANTDRFIECVVTIPIQSWNAELVVTPETQNVWGGSRYYGSVATATIGIGSAEPTGFLPLNSSSMTARRTLTGRCNAPTSSADDLGCSIENMPVGSYKIEATGLYNIILGSSTNNTVCSFEIYETTSSTSVSNGTYKRNGQQNGIVYQPSSQSGIFQNSAVATRNFVIRANKTFDDHTTNNGACQVYIANSGVDISSFNITVTPIDNNSNSALYVQGPVKASATGTAIPAGSVGEKVTWTTPPSLQNVTTTESDWTNASITLTSGVWLVTANVFTVAQIASGQPAGAYAATRVKITDSSNNVIQNQYKTLAFFASSATTGIGGGETVLPFSFVASVSTTTTYKIRVVSDRSGGGNSGVLKNAPSGYSEFYAIRLN
jgi:hypothetical protein